MLICLHGSGQQFLTGKVYKANSTEHLISVSVHNITQQRYDLSEEDGSYRIQAAPGDHISFSSVGYKADTVTVTASLLTAAYTVYLDVRAQTLQTVRVGQFSNYQLDSLDRRKEYAWVYDHGNTPRMARDRQGADGVGVTLNVFRNTSSAAKQRVKLEKRLEKEEEEFYVDSRYNKDYVTKITKLKGDSLSEFMRKYRPSYDYCRKAANVDILVYINDSYKQYMKGDN
ncbi:MAG TPA: carboxypeptidase-like regulatory domain-containing protein [Puia sp.]|nr:carboxypeptidase-like regulatory domain-containing protein [Puia sp.]